MNQEVSWEDGWEPDYPTPCRHGKLILCKACDEEEEYFDSHTPPEKDLGDPCPHNVEPGLSCHACRFDEAVAGGAP